MKTRPGVV